MAFAIIPLSMKAYVTTTATSGDYTLYALKFVSNNEDEDDIEGVQAIYTTEDLQIPLLSTQQWYGTYYNPIDDGTNYIFKAAYLGDKYTTTVDKTDSDTLSGSKAMVFTNDNAEGRLLPNVTAEDNGKTLAVIDGEWNLSESGGGSEPIIINAIAGQAGANFNSQFSSAITAITSTTMRSHSQSKGIASETGQAILDTLVQDPTKSKDAYLLYSYGTHLHVVKCSQILQINQKNMGGQNDVGDRIDFLFEGTVFQPAIADLPTPIVKFVIDIYRVAMEGRFLYNCIVYGYGV